MQQDVQGKVDSRAMREVNRSIVLDIIRRGGKVSRTDLAKRSTLTKPTVSTFAARHCCPGVVPACCLENHVLRDKTTRITVRSD